MSCPTPTPGVQPVLEPGLRVLVVDDVPTNRTLLAKLLQRQGCSTVEACNGVEAVAAVAEQVFDVILMDLQMPEMDGLEATRQIRSSGNEVPIVAVTANVSLADRNDCFVAGMTEFLPKPVNSARLLQVVSGFSRNEN